LSLNEAKTQIVHASTGFDFLGFNVRRYQTRQGGKLLIKPSKTAIKRIRQRLSAEVRALRGATPADIIGTLNPIIRGWAAYYRPVVASETFGRLDSHLWPLLYRWARRRHPRKSRHWVAGRYFGQFNKTRRDRWVFGDRDSGAYLHKFAWTRIVRHPSVTGAASPDDPALARYWADRRRRQPPHPGTGTTLRLIHAQHGRCPLCGDYLLHTDQEPQSPSQWEQWFTATRLAMTRHAITSHPNGRTDEHRRLVHAFCHRRNHPGKAEDPASNCTASTPQRPA
jgi:RNA-directed DNA polymerase